MYTAYDICSITMLDRPFMVVSLLAQPPGLTTLRFCIIVFRLKPY